MNLPISLPLTKKARIYPDEFLETYTGIMRLHVRSVNTY